MSNLSAADFQFISASEFRVLEGKFSEYSNSNEIGYEEFKDILVSNNRITKEILSPFLEKVKKKLRDSGNIDADHLSKNKYFELIIFFFFKYYFIGKAFIITK